MKAFVSLLTVSTKEDPTAGGMNTQMPQNSSESACDVLSLLCHQLFFYLTKHEASLPFILQLVDALDVHNFFPPDFAVQNEIHFSGNLDSGPPHASQAKKNFF